MQDWAEQIVTPDRDAAAAYYPWVQITDPFTLTTRYVPPSGSVAGVYATTDAAQGVWKAPAGITAPLRNVTALADPSIDDTATGDLNTAGINCVRSFEGHGNVVWGARTLAGADLNESPFKYVPTRRLADFITQSLQQSLQWAVFEPNGPSLWAMIALETTTFMAGLYAAGAFSGATASTAYEVTCDATTTSVADRQAGIVNLRVGFTTVEPGEFIELAIVVHAAA
jgi:uncharacterized protein